MQSCSVHHCVLFLLTLTLTTDPGSATVFPIYAKLNESVTLPCGAQCSGRAKWSLDYNRDVVFARCDQTSCTSVKDGYEMSYDRYKSGDLSLTITNPDYSLRKTYSCECDYSDYATVNLRISTVFSEVQMSPEGDLKLDLSVPEPVEVIYRGSVLGDGVQICTVTNRTLQCKSEYTPRTSLSNSEITLRHVKPWDSGTYTIRNLDYKEDIRVYAVSVSAVFSAVPVQTVEDLKLDLSVPESVLKLEVIYESRDSADDVQICTVTNRTLQCNDKYTPRTSLSYPELTLRHMMPWDSGTYTIRNLDYKEDIRVYAVSVEAVSSAVPVQTEGDLKLDVFVPESVLKVEVIYKSSDSADDVQICTVTNRTLQCKSEYTPRTSLSYPELTLRYMGRSESGTYTIRDTENKRDIRVYSVSVSGLTPGETAGIVIPLLFLLAGLIAGVWYMKRKAEREKQEAERKNREVLEDFKPVDELLIQAPHKRPEEVKALWQQVEKKINDLEQKYINYPSSRIICTNKRELLNQSKLAYEMKVQKHESLVVTVEKAVKIFKKLKDEATSRRRVISSEELNEMFTRVDKHMRYINFWCSENSTYLENSDPEIKVFMKNVDMESHVHRVQQWYEQKMMELSRYKEVLPPQAPRAPQNTEGEERKPFV